MRKGIMGLAMLLLAGVCFGQNTLVVVPLQNRGSQGLANDVATLTELLGNAVVRTGRFDVVDRAALEDLMREHEFQMDDWSSDSKSVEMGRVLNANYIIRGQVSRLGSQMIVTARVLDISTARILGTSEMQLLNMDEAYGKMGNFVNTLVGSVQPTRRPSAASQSGQMEPVQEETAQPSQTIVREDTSTVQDFTTGQRWTTFALNAVPSLGSFLIMKDTKGGITHVILGVLGWGLVFAGPTVGTSSSSSSSGDYSYSTEPTEEVDVGSIVSAAGWAILGADLIVNIVRSASYHKPQPRTASLIDPAAWNIAIVPSKNGIEKVHLSYTMHF